MKQIVPEIYVKDCLSALAFYKELFGGEVRNVQMSDDIAGFQHMRGRVVHSELHISSRCIFYFIDIFDPHREHVGNVTLVLHMHTKQEMQHVYQGLAEGGDVVMEMQRTYTGSYHAIVTDRFGAPWALDFAPRKKSVSSFGVSAVRR